MLPMRSRYFNLFPIIPNYYCDVSDDDDDDYVGRGG